MANALIEWLRGNVPLLTAIGGVGVFVLFGWRKLTWEIRKLRLEVAKLKDESRIYRPTQEEIERVLREAGKLPTRKLGILGAVDALSSFRQELQEFLVVLAAYYGNPAAQKQIAERRLWAVMNQRSDPYPSGCDRHPNPEFIFSTWNSVREVAWEKLPRNTFQTIERFLGRFPSKSARVKYWEIKSEQKNTLCYPTSLVHTGLVAF